MLKLYYIGIDDWDRPVYKDNAGKLWKDIELGDLDTPVLYSAVEDDIDGEPNMPIREEFTIVKPYIKSRHQFEYMMLDRLRIDCETHLDTKNKYARRLRGDEKQGTLQEMKRLWGLFPENEKPEWLTWEQILEYEEKIFAE